MIATTPETEQTPATVAESMLLGMRSLGADRLYARVDLAHLNIDPRYQRQLNKDRVRQMAENYDEKLIGVLTCSVRENGIFVIDGQHRLEVLKARGIAEAQCELRSGLTVQQEAAMFYHLDSDRRGLSGDDAFRALLAAEDEIALQIKQAIEDAGLTVRFHGNIPNGVRAYKTLIGIARDKRYGIQHLRDVLMVVGQAWPDTFNASASAILRGMSHFLRLYPEIDRRELIRKLSDHTTPNRLVMAGRNIRESLGHTSEPSMAKAILGIYNFRRTTNKLEDRT